MHLRFPTPLHQQVAETSAAHFAADPQVDTVLVVNSCARGVATPHSDLDMQVLVNPGVDADELRAMEARWHKFRAQQPIYQDFAQTGQFAHLHLDLTPGEFIAQPWDDGGGPDTFEIGIGNLVAYSAPLGESGPHLGALRARWLPYYDEALRLDRLAMVREACLYDLAHVPFFAGRGLYFQSFDRLYKAFQEFLQALFISRRVYPIAYNKWIQEQVKEWLGLPELYAQLPGIISISELESRELEDRADRLRDLLDHWAR